MFGAMGSGKTYAVCAEAIAWALEQPGIRGLITRKTIPELRDTTETVFFDVLPDELLRAGKTTRLGGHTADFTFPNGSKILFRGIDDWKKHKSLNLGFIAWDEMDEFDEETYIGMLARIRQRDPTAEGRRWGAGKITRRGTWGASNPEGHNWIWKRFVKEPKAGRSQYFRSTSFDNAYLSTDYYENLLSMPEPWIKRYVLCQFDDFAGQIYEAWNSGHMVPRYGKNIFTGEPVYPDHSVHWMGLDPGMRDPTAGLWVVVEREPRLRLVGVAEYQETGLDVVQHSQAFRRIEARHRLRVTKRIADPNRINIRDVTTPTKLSDAYRRRGFRFDLGPSRWDDRIPALGTLISNGQFVVTEDCPMTFESIRDARWKDLSPAARARGDAPPEEPEKKNRHLCDTAEYLAGQYKKPIMQAPEYPDTMPEWQIAALKTIRTKLQAAGRGRQQHEVEGIPA
jgi:PBSX family phage terminase large subunit